MRIVIDGRLRTFRVFALASALTCASVALDAMPAFATTPLCDAKINFENVERPRLVQTPCTVADRDFIVESGYYQNASAVGGTALAAYPNLRIRYGVNRRVDAFYDAPPEVAKSGLGGVGIYKYEHSGVGAKWTVRSDPNFALALSGEIGPPNAPLSILDARERYTVGANALLRVGKIQLGSMLAFYDGQRFGRMARSEFNIRDGVSAGYDIDKITRASAEILTQAGGSRNRTRAYTFGDFFIQRRLAPAVLFDVEIGTSFNPVRGTKPHYIGAGISFMP